MVSFCLNALSSAAPQKAHDKRCAVATDRITITPMKTAIASRDVFSVPDVGSIVVSFLPLQSACRLQLVCQRAAYAFELWASQIPVLVALSEVQHGWKCALPFLRKCTGVVSLTCTAELLAQLPPLKSLTELQLRDFKWEEHGLLQRFPSLQRLSIDTLPEPRRPGAAVPDLQHLHQLKSLELRSKFDVRTSVAGIAAQLKHLRHLETFTLSACIDAKGMQAVASELKHLEALHTVRLSEDAVGAEGAKALAASMKHLPHLRTLELRCSRLGADGARTIADALALVPHLRSLDLAQNDLGNAGVTTIAAKLVDAKHLHSLSLAGNRFDGAAGTLAAQLHHVPLLHTLDLSRCDLGDEGVTRMAGALPCMQHLSRLALESNRIQDSGATALANQLSHTRHLHELALGRNYISDFGVSAIAQQFRHLPSLRNLSLATNFVTANGVKAIAAQVHFLEYLQALNLCHNRIDDDGAKHLAESLQSLNRCAIALDLRENRLSDSVAETLAAAHNGAFEWQSSTLTFA